MFIYLTPRSTDEPKNEKPIHSKPENLVTSCEAPNPTLVGGRGKDMYISLGPWAIKYLGVNHFEPVVPLKSYLG